MDKHNRATEEITSLMEANKEGRVLVLPCTVGDEIYCVMDGRIYPKLVVAIHVFVSNHFQSIEIQAQNGRGAITPVPVSDFGVRAFRSREDAEDKVTADMGGRRCYACCYWCPPDTRCLCERSQWFLAQVLSDNYCGQFKNRDQNTNE